MNTQFTSLTLVDRLVEVLVSFGTSPAIQIDGRVISYADLAVDVARAKETLIQNLNRAPISASATAIAPAILPS